MPSILRVIFCVALIASTAACSTIDNVERRTTTMNLNISEAENKGILLNLARSSLEEPLSFSALANYTGHQTIGGTVGLPNLGFAGNPLNLTSLGTTGTGANGSLSNDFSYVGNDDNATYAALLQPIDPTTLAYFLRQEYPRELLFFLVISKIRVIHEGRLRYEYENSGTTLEEVLRDGPSGTQFVKFGTKLQSLVDSGLTAQIDVTTNSRSKFCFDRLIGRIYGDDPDVHPSSYEPTCQKAQIFDNKAGASPDKDDKKDGKSADKKDAHKKAAASKPPAFASSYKFHDGPTGDDVEIFLRSPFGIYRYLGLLIAKKATVAILKDPNAIDRVIVTITHDDNDCFVSEVYRGQLYCVPNQARTTKRVFALLHDLVKLYTFPSAAPLTISARLVPGGG